MDGYQPLAKRWRKLLCCECKEQLQQRPCQETSSSKCCIRWDNRAWTLPRLQRERGGHWWLRITISKYRSPSKDGWRRWVEAVSVGPVAKLVGRNKIINCCLRSSAEKGGLMAAQLASGAVTKEASRLCSTVQYCQRYICVSSYPTLISRFW